MDILTKHSFFTEYDVALYIIQLLKALKYMHDFEIAHLGLTVSILNTKSKKSYTLFLINHCVINILAW